MLFMGIGCALEAPPWRTIAEVARDSNHSWSTTRNVLELLHTLGLLNRVGVRYFKRYQYRQLVEAQDNLESERAVEGALKGLFLGI